MNNIVNNSSVRLVAALVVLLILVVAAGWLTRRKTKVLDTQKFKTRWHEAQKFCSSKETWPLAIINADTLLDEALKKRRYKGKTMGERLVAAQHDLSDNDGVWFSHKLRNKLVHEELKKLKKRDVQDALVGTRQALRDLGALE